MAENKQTNKQKKTRNTINLIDAMPKGEFPFKDYVMQGIFCVHMIITGARTPFSLNDADLYQIKIYAVSE